MVPLKHLYSKWGCKSKTYIENHIFRNIFFCIISLVSFLEFSSFFEFCLGASEIRNFSTFFNGFRYVFPNWLFTFYKFYVNFLILILIFWYILLLLGLIFVNFLLFLSIFFPRFFFWYFLLIYLVFFNKTAFSWIFFCYLFANL